MKRALLAIAIPLIIASNASAATYTIGMTDGTSGHPSMGSTVHYPTLWSGLWSSGTDYLVTYVKFDLSSIQDSEIITSMTLSGTVTSFGGDSIINAYHVDDDTLGGVSYSTYTYNAFHNYNAYLGSEGQSGTGLYTFNISGYGYSSDLADNWLTVALTSTARTEGSHWVVFDRNLNLNIETANPVPEPSTLLLLGSGMAGLGLMRFRKRGKA